MTLDESIAVGEGQPRLHRRFSALDACSELAQFGQGTGKHLLEPLLQEMPLAMSKHACERLSQLISLLHLGARLPDEGQVVLLGFVSVLRFLDQEPHRAFGRKVFLPLNGSCRSALCCGL